MTSGVRASSGDGPVVELLWRNCGRNVGSAYLEMYRSVVGLRIFFTFFTFVVLLGVDTFAGCVPRKLF